MKSHNLIPADNKASAEEGWEQPGRQGGSRSGRGSGRGSHTPNILQRPDRAPGAWGNANQSQANAAPQVGNASRTSVRFCLACNKTVCIFVCVARAWIRCQTGELS